MKTFHTLVFDLGGVLIDWNPAYLYRKIFSDEEEMRYFLTEICHGAWNEQQDAGRSLVEATELLVREHPAYETPIRAYYGRWEEMLAGALEGTVRILEELWQAGSFRLFALTNWSHETFPIAQQRFGFLQYFEGILVSGEEKMKKPDPAIYRCLIERFAIDPHQSIFIDDNLRNVRAAEPFGFTSLHFQSPEDLRIQLQELGVF